MNYQTLFVFGQPALVDTVPFSDDLRGRLLCPAGVKAYFTLRR
ncbi:hypothetical protein [Neisseria sicca]|nr:hypothetical protein [Neisseria sicca]